MKAEKIHCVGMMMKMISVKMVVFTFRADFNGGGSFIRLHAVLLLRVRSCYDAFIFV